MNKAIELGEEKISKLLLKYSMPAIIGMLTNALYSIVDRIFVGQSVGPLAIAGITVSFPVLMIMMACTMLIGIGGNALVSIRLGESRKEDAEVILGNSFSLLLIVSLIMTVTGILFLEPLLIAFGASSEVLPYATDFLKIILYGSVFQSIGFGMNNFIRGEGNPRIAMLTMILGTVLNFILCPIFIFVLGWGIKGSALATVLSQSAAAFCVIYYFLSGTSNLKFRLKNLIIRKDVALGIVSIGFAPFVLQIAQSGVSTIMNKTLGHFGGDNAISAMGIAMSFVMLVFMPIFGITQGVQPIIGFNFGAQKYKRVIEGFKMAAISATVIVSVGFLVMQLAPVFIMKLFTKDEPELVNYGVMFLRYFCIFLPIIGFQIVTSSYFQSVGKSSQAAILGLSRQVVFLIPLMLILPLFFQIKGIIYAGPISDLLSTLLAVFLITREFRKLRLLIVEKPVQLNS